jgi:hypothetical protein
MLWARYWLCKEYLPDAKPEQQSEKLISKSNGNALQYSEKGQCPSPLLFCMICGLPVIY